MYVIINLIYQHFQLKTFYCNFFLNLPSYVMMFLNFLHYLIFHKKRVYWLNHLIYLNILNNEFCFFLMSFIMIIYLNHFFKKSKIYYEIKYDVILQFLNLKVCVLFHFFSSILFKVKQ